MLFNSYEFIFVFLPVTVAVFFLLGSASRTWALRWMILASLLFYAWWRPVNILILAPAIAVNFIVARQIQRLRGRAQHGPAKALLVLGILANIGFLGYFKYANFAVGVFNDVLGTDFVLAAIILPLGISFITFQKIAFLIDVHAGHIESFTLQDYCLFVLFFPQLIAGPIVHYRELMPQFRGATCRFDGDAVAIGVTLFVSGLFKKAVLADGIAPLVAPIYERAAAGDAIALVPAWMAAVGFTLQIYFDFSGYTDMALGVARLFGVRLPPNFNSPLQAASIIDFWSRWHMTLTRFLTAYVYNPLVLSLTRRRLASGRAVLNGRSTRAAAFVVLTMCPTLLTMLVSGVWHGAGYLFILWGLLHGVFLTVNHAWRLHRRRVAARPVDERLTLPIYWALTLLCVAVSMVLFRSQTLAAATTLLQGLIGMNGVGLASGSGFAITRMAGWILLLGVIALGCPNTLQWLARYEPALGWKPERVEISIGGRRLGWNASPAWAAAVAVVAALAIVRTGGPSEFLYWQF
jgi:D-alanyl-lipoteichoic acid acyltransferase DltB (MBOAT superfamily)